MLMQVSQTNSKTESQLLIEDSKLIISFNSSDTKNIAYSLLVKKYNSRLRLQIVKIIGHEDIEDVLQNVFMKVWDNLIYFNERSSLYTWLYRITINEAINWLNYQKRHRSVSIDNHISGRDIQLISEMEVDLHSKERHLLHAIRKLPPKQRIVFIARYSEGMPYKEIATIYNISCSSLKASYHFAKEKLRENLLSK